MRQPGEWGDEHCIVLLSCAYKVCIRVVPATVAEYAIQVYGEQHSADGERTVYIGAFPDLQFVACVPPGFGVGRGNNARRRTGADDEFEELQPAPKRGRGNEDVMAPFRQT